MAAIGLRPRARARLIPNAEPNVIPFIDVLLVLLIIFMVTAPKPTTDLRVDLPTPGPSRPVTIPPTIVDIRAAPGRVRLFIGAEEIASDALASAALAHMLAADRTLSTEDALRGGRVFIRAELAVPYQSVVSVVDDLQQAEFSNVSIAAQNADRP
jgi:biopolymer transport protein ExbD